MVKITNLKNLTGTCVRNLVKLYMLDMVKIDTIVFQIVGGGGGGGVYKALPPRGVNCPKFPGWNRVKKYLPVLIMSN